MIYTLSSTLRIAVQRIHATSKGLPNDCRTSTIHHTPLIDLDALYYAERTIQSISGNAREAALSHTPTLSLKTVVHTLQTAMIVIQISLTREGVASSYNLGVRLR